MAGDSHPAGPRPAADRSADRRRVAGEVPPVVDVDPVLPALRVHTILVDHVVVDGAARPSSPLTCEVGDLDEVLRAVDGSRATHRVARVVTAATADATCTSRVLDVERESGFAAVEEKVWANAKCQPCVVGVLGGSRRQRPGLQVVLGRRRNRVDEQDERDHAPDCPRPGSRLETARFPPRFHRAGQPEAQQHDQRREQNRDPGPPPVARDRQCDERKRRPEDRPAERERTDPEADDGPPDGPGLGQRPEGDTRDEDRVGELAPEVPEQQVERDERRERTDQQHRHEEVREELPNRNCLAEALPQRPARNALAVRHPTNREQVGGRLSTSRRLSPAGRPSP